ncbi:MAG: hypothetical protein MJZ34_10420 [Paludibacteraceae bacterium]|nr:hypothetical protein [Paludibacteraceae bacterium]
MTKEEFQNIKTLNNDNLFDVLSNVFLKTEKPNELLGSTDYQLYGEEGDVNSNEPSIFYRENGKERKLTASEVDKLREEGKIFVADKEGKKTNAIENPLDLSSDEMKGKKFFYRKNKTWDSSMVKDGKTTDAFKKVVESKEIAKLKEFFDGTDIEMQKYFNDDVMDDKSMKYLRSLSNMTGGATLDEKEDYFYSLGQKYAKEMLARNYALYRANSNNPLTKKGNVKYDAKDKVLNKEMLENAVKSSRGDSNKDYFKKGTNIDKIIELAIEDLKAQGNNPPEDAKIRLNNSFVNGQENTFEEERKKEVQDKTVSGGKRQGYLYGISEMMKDGANAVADWLDKEPWNLFNCAFKVMAKIYKSGALQKIASGAKTVKDWVSNEYKSIMADSKKGLEEDEPVEEKVKRDGAKKTLDDLFTKLDNIKEATFVTDFVNSLLMEADGEQPQEEKPKVNKDDIKKQIKQVFENEYNAFLNTFNDMFNDLNVDEYGKICENTIDDEHKLKLSTRKKSSLFNALIVEGVLNKEEADNAEKAVNDRQEKIDSGDVVENTISNALMDFYKSSLNEAEEEKKNEGGVSDEYKAWYKKNFVENTKPIMMFKPNGDVAKNIEGLCNKYGVNKGNSLNSLMNVCDYFTSMWKKCADKGIEIETKVEVTDKINAFANFKNDNGFKNDYYDAFLTKLNDFKEHNGTNPMPDYGEGFIFARLSSDKVPNMLLGHIDPSINDVLKVLKDKLK